MEKVKIGNSSLKFKTDYAELNLIEFINLYNISHEIERLAAKPDTLENRFNLTKLLVRQLVNLSVRKNKALKVLEQTEGLGFSGISQINNAIQSSFPDFKVYYESIKPVNSFYIKSKDSILPTKFKIYTLDEVTVYREAMMLQYLTLLDKLHLKILNSGWENLLKFVAVACVRYSEVKEVASEGKSFIKRSSRVEVTYREYVAKLDIESDRNMERFKNLKFTTALGLLKYYTDLKKNNRKL